MSNLATVQKQSRQFERLRALQVAEDIARARGKRKLAAKARKARKMVEAAK